jgi:hypothetical protein
MPYRNWTITVHSSYLGFSVECTAPFGESYESAAAFATCQQAVSYAKVMIDSFVDYERSRFRREAVCA